jgi:hypothetical protein
VTLSDVLVDIDVVLLTVDGANACIVAVSLRYKAVSLVDKDGDRDKLPLVLWEELSMNLNVDSIAFNVQHGTNVLHNLRNIVFGQQLQLNGSIEHRIRNSVLRLPQKAADASRGPLRREQSGPK